MVRKTVVCLLVGLLVLGLGATTALAERKVVLGLESGTIQDVIGELIPQMEKDLGVKIEFKTWPLYQMYEVVMLMLTSGESTVDLTTWGNRWLGDMGPYFTDLSTLGNVEEDFHVDQIVAGFREPYMQYRGKWVGVTYDGDTCVLMYRKDLFEDPAERAAYKKKYSRALKPPETYEEYNDIAEFFTRPEQGIWGHAAIYARTWENTAFFFDRLYSRGGELWDGEGNARIDDEIGIWAIENYVEGIKYAPLGYLEVGWAEQRRLFFEGKVAMAAVWTDGPKGAADPETTIEKVRRNFGTAVLPGKFTYMFGGRLLGIPKNTPNDKKDAYAVLKWLNRPELTTKLAANPATHLDPWMVFHFDDPSIYKDMHGVGSAAEFCLETMKTIENGLPHVNIRFFRRYEDALSTRIAQAVSGEMAPEAAIKAAADDWDRLTDEIGADIMLPEVKDFHRVLREERGYTGFLREPNWND